MPDLKDNPTDLINLAREIMMKNNDIRQQELERQYGHYGEPGSHGGRPMPPDPVEIPTEPVIDAERDSGAEMVNPEEIIAGSSGLEQTTEE